MSAPARNDLLPDLAQLADVFEALRRGKHLCLRDGPLYQDLRLHEADYEALFHQLGFRLVRHARDFYYFHDASNFTDLSARMAVFVFILVEFLADRGEPVEETLLTRPFAYADLPHLHGERTLGYMKEAGVATPEDLAKIVQNLERFGFARRLDATSFQFEAPIYRFLDLCMELAARPDAAPPDADPAANAASDLPDLPPEESA